MAVVELDVISDGEVGEVIAGIQDGSEKTGSNKQSRLNCFSNSTNCLRKLKLGDIVGPLNFTYLYASSEFILKCWITYAIAIVADRDIPSSGMDIKFLKSLSYKIISTLGSVQYYLFDNFKLRWKTNNQQ